jgi:general secretion pathway protein H
MKDFNKYSGFTLLELLVVLGILTLVLAIVPPLLPNVISSTKIKTATRDIAASLKIARSQAINQQRESRLTLNVKDKLIYLGEQKKRLELPEDTELLLVTASAEQQSEDEGSILFFPDGSSTGGRIEIAYDQDRFLIDVNWLTGKIKISP